MLISSCSEIHSPVAQSVEQVAVNHPVGGSNPSGGARTNLYFGRGFFSLPCMNNNLEVRVLCEYNSNRKIPNR